MPIVIQKVREQLAARGARSIRGFSRVFKIFDDAGDRKLSKDDLVYGLQDYGLDISGAEVETLISELDKDGSGSLSFDEFLVGLRGAPNEARQAFIDQAFAKFDADGSGQITLEDIKGVYNVDHHPEVLSGEVSADDAFKEFMDTFGNADGDASISKKEWDDYYAAVSASMDNDDEFGLMMTNAWQL